jgi:hypothetical protein
MRPPSSNARKGSVGRKEAARRHRAGSQGDRHQPHEQINAVETSRPASLPALGWIVAQSRSHDPDFDATADIAL